MGRNIDNTPTSVILDQMTEKRPLPVGMTEFDIWSDRVISGTGLPATPESQKFALAQMLINLKPTEDHECDAYFIKALRKSAINQIAVAKMEQIRDEAKARLKAEEAEAAQLNAAATPVVTTADVVSINGSKA